MMKEILLLASVTLSFSTNATLIDRVNFTYDSEQGIDWLDFTETAGLSYNDALAANVGWRLATNLEIENLHATAFEGYFSTSPNDFSSALGGGSPYSEQEEDFTNWISLFGDTEFPVQSSRGFYLDENSIWRIIGVTVSGGNSLIFGTNFGFDGSSDIGGRDGYGFALVRTAAVPAPPTIWLIGATLIGLASLRKKLRPDSLMRCTNTPETIHKLNALSPWVLNDG